MKITTAKKCKIKIAATAVVLSVVFIAVVIILCESFGLYPGHWLNRIAVSSYMSDNHPGVEYTVLSQKFEETEKNNYGSKMTEKAYVYKLRLDNTENKGETFEVKAYSFDVISDGYFVGYLRNNELEKGLGTHLCGLISAEYDKTYGESKSSILSVDCFAVLTYEKYPSSETYDYNKIISDLNGNYDITICIKGENVEYDPYSKIAENVVDVVHNKLGLSPSFTQLIYYRKPADEADLKKADVVYNDLIMQYESRIESYQLTFDIENSSDMHFFVELDSDQERNAKIYNYFQTFYIIFVAVVVMALLGLWSFRKFKKWNGILKAEKNNRVVEIVEEHIEESAEESADE